MKSVNQELKGRTCFVTGADGFIGSHLTEKLVELGADVRVFVRATSSGQLRNIVHIREKVKVHQGDLADRTAVDRAIKTLKDGNSPIIFHLGAQAHVGESWERPYETVWSNVVGTLNLLQSVVDHDVKLHKFDTAGTSEEYGNVNPTVEHHHDFHEKGGVILSERSPINPKSIYATSKLAADFLTMNYFDAYGLPGVTTRMFNNYGPRQNPRYVTGTIITQALTRDVVELGYVKAKRDFCFVEDGVMGHIHVALWGTPGQVYVYGQGKNISIMDWMGLILAVGQKNGRWGTRTLKINEGRFRPGKSDVEELLVGYEKLNRLSGWEPAFSWEQGILKTIDWFAAHKEQWLGRVDWL
jgi:dTDP-glucose 4,6-dehydratase